MNINNCSNSSIGYDHHSPTIVEVDGWLDLSDSFSDLSLSEFLISGTANEIIVPPTPREEFPHDTCKTAPPCSCPIVNLAGQINQNKDGGNNRRHEVPLEIDLEMRLYDEPDHNKNDLRSSSSQEPPATAVAAAAAAAAQDVLDRLSKEEKDEVEEKAPTTVETNEDDDGPEDAAPAIVLAAAQDEDDYESSCQHHEGQEQDSHTAFCRLDSGAATELQANLNNNKEEEEGPEVGPGNNDRAAGDEENGNDEDERDASGNKTDHGGSEEEEETALLQFMGVAGGAMDDPESRKVLDMVSTLAPAEIVCRQSRSGSDDGVSTLKSVGSATVLGKVWQDGIADVRDEKDAGHHRMHTIRSHSFNRKQMSMGRSTSQKEIILALESQREKMCAELRVRASARALKRNKFHVNTTTV